MVHGRSQVGKDGVSASELVDGEPSMSKSVTAEDLRLLHSSKSTVLKPRGVEGSGSGRSAYWAYFTEPVVDETEKVAKRITYCCVTSEKGEQCRAKLNLTSAGTINHLSAKHGINLQRGLVRQTETASIKQKCDTLFQKPYDRDSTTWKTKFSALCKFISKDMRPVHLSQGSGFKEFCAAMDPRFSLPSQAMINAQLQTEYTS